MTTVMLTHKLLHLWNSFALMQHSISQNSQALPTHMSEDPYRSPLAAPSVQSLALEACG